MFEPTFKITTPYGGWYITSQEGYVLQCDNGLDKRGASESQLRTWQITGIKEIKPFNNLGELIPISEAVELTKLRFKNGKPRYTIADIDHGTHRIHGNWNVHGVSTIEII